MKRIARLSLGVAAPLATAGAIWAGPAAAAAPTLLPVYTVPMARPYFGSYSMASDGSFWRVNSDHPGGPNGTISHFDPQGRLIQEYHLVIGSLTPLDIGYYGGRVYVSDSTSCCGDVLRSWTLAEIEKGEAGIASDHDTSGRLGSVGFFFRIDAGGNALAALGQSNKVAALDLDELFFEHPFYPQEVMGAGINTNGAPVPPAGNQFESCVGGYGPKYKPCGTDLGRTPSQNGSNGFDYPVDTALVPGGFDVADYLDSEISFVSETPGPFGEAGPRLEEAFGIGIVSSPQSIIRDPRTGDIFVSSEGTRRIDAFGPGDEYLGSFGYGVSDGADTFESCGPEAAPCRLGIAREADDRSLFTHLDFGPEGALYAYMPLAEEIQVFAVGELPAPSTEPPGSGGSGSGGESGGSAGGSGGSGSGSGGSEGSGGKPTPIPPPLPAPPGPEKLQCKKGFKKKKVKGKAHCVRRHHNHHHGHGHARV